ncbi:hypothetical protein ABWI13_21470 [Streptomyces koyangensis]|uniref:hypothetical protein n=2 Tax=Streptomyces TaxID=1883 RepID=UPI000C6EF1AC|nr:hypothetical protein CWE27_04105 [Streptomyces sp. EAG2]
MSADARVPRSQFSPRLRPLSAPQPMARHPRRIWSELVELTHRKAGSADVPAGLILHSLLGVRNDAGPAPTEGGRARV